MDRSQQPTGRKLASEILTSSLRSILIISIIVAPLYWVICTIRDRCAPDYLVWIFEMISNNGNVTVILSMAPFVVLYCLTHKKSKSNDQEKPDNSEL